MSDFYKNKKCVVAGGSGLIGCQVVKLLLEQDAIVTVVSLDDGALCPKGALFTKTDLTEYSNCLKVCEDQEYVFNLMGAKGSPKMCSEKPSSFLVSMMLYNYNLARAAKDCKVFHYQYTSSVGVYQPAEILQEDSVWTTLVSSLDFFAGNCKRAGEMQLMAYEKEFGWKDYSIIRPTAIYGPQDNFSTGSMVVPSILTRVFKGENPLKIWDSGLNQRDWLYSEDCARGILHMVQNKVKEPVNLGTGKPNTVRDLINVIKKYSFPDLEVEYNESASFGDNKRIMDISRARSYDWEPKYSLEEGIKLTIDWYKENKYLSAKRFNVFN